MARTGERRVRAGVGAAVAGAALSALTLVTPSPAGAGGGDWLCPDQDRYEPCQQIRLVGYAQALARSTIDERVLTTGAGYRPTATTVPPAAPEPATPATTSPPASEPVSDAGKSPAGRAGEDPAGGVSSEVVAWLMGFGVLLVVWVLAWRWRPQETHMVVRQGNGERDDAASDDDPRPVHIEL